MKKSLSNGKRKKAAKQSLPQGWNEKRINDLIAYYDNQTDEEGAAEYEAGMAIIDGQSMMLVPTELMPEIRKLIARHQRAR